MDWKTRMESALEAAIDEDVLEELAQHAAATYASARAEGCDAAQAEARVAEQIQAWAADPAIRRRRPKRPAVVEPPAGSAPPFTAVAQDTRYAWRLLRRQPAYAALVDRDDGARHRRHDRPRQRRLRRAAEAAAVGRRAAARPALRDPPGQHAAVPADDDQRHATSHGATRRPRRSTRIGAWSPRSVTVAEPARISSRIKVAGRHAGSAADASGGRPRWAARSRRGSEEPGRPPDRRSCRTASGSSASAAAPTSSARRCASTATTYTIVGVMPASFMLPGPRRRARGCRSTCGLSITPGIAGRRIQMFQAIGRLRDGVTPEQAAAEGTARGTRRAADHARRDDGGLRQQRPRRGHRGAAAPGADRRRQAGDPDPARRRGAAAGHGHRERRQPAARARDGAAPRARDPHRARRRARPARAADARREPAARAARRRSPASRSRR